MADDGDHSLSKARICIDFGTALSKASVCLDPTMPLSVGVRPLPIGAAAGAEQRLLTPSVLFVDSGRIYFGPIALEHACQGIDKDREPLLSFKTVLAATDLQAALNARISPTMDPTGTLRQRDAMVLYLAYLDQLIRHALQSAINLPPGVSEVRRRYTSPVWRRDGNFDQVFQAIFNEAAAVSLKLGRLLLSEDGISIAQCKSALDQAAQMPGIGRLETGVFEPHAAAAASLAFTNTPTRFILVFDMGAGTTDLAAFEFDERTDPPALTEIKQARQCSPLAGDEIDRILLDVHWRKRGGQTNNVEDVRFLRAARIAARDMKKELFETGKCGLRYGGRTSVLEFDDLWENETFQRFLNALARTVQASLAAVMARADAAHARYVDVVLAGGGSHLPFMVDLVNAARGEMYPRINLRIGPLSPTSQLYDSVDASLGEVFPQLAISIGGAIVELLPT